MYCEKNNHQALWLLNGECLNYPLAVQLCHNHNQVLRQEDEAISSDQELDRPWNRWDQLRSTESVYEANTLPNEMRSHSLEYKVSSRVWCRFWARSHTGRATANDDIVEVVAIGSRKLCCGRHFNTVTRQSCTRAMNSKMSEIVITWTKIWRKKRLDWVLITLKSSLKFSSADPAFKDKSCEAAVSHNFNDQGCSGFFRISVRYCSESIAWSRSLNRSGWYDLWWSMRRAVEASLSDPVYVHRLSVRHQIESRSWAWSLSEQRFVTMDMTDCEFLDSSIPLQQIQSHW